MKQIISALLNTKDPSVLKGVLDYIPESIVMTDNEKEAFTNKALDQLHILKASVN